MANKNLTNAKRVKNDEFYTQYSDIQKEIEAYLEYNPDVFRGKVVYCNCDDPFESNFFRYFVLNFNKLGLKQIITTSYKPSPVANTQLGLFGDDKTFIKSKGRPKVTANKFIINEVHDIDGDGEFNLKDVAKQLKANKYNEWMPLSGDGDFRSDECLNLLKQSDIVVTNPPFSLFREYVKQLFDYNKKFVIIGNMNSITYKEIKGKKSYDKYDNYDAIEVPFTDSIPSDYNGVMGVPISFLDKYNPDQFEIIGASDNGVVDEKYKLPHFKKHNEPYVNGKKQYKRIFIKHKKK